jgi:hypothetical protein
MERASGIEIVVEHENMTATNVGQRGLSKVTTPEDSVPP